MGYESTFSGSMSPSRPIPEELVRKINGADISFRVVVPGGYYDDCDGEAGDVVPASRNMKAYDWVEELMMVQRLLDPLHIGLTGEIFREGESGDDFERLKAYKGRITVSAGEVKYGRGRKVTVMDVTRYAILMTRVRRGKPCTEACFMKPVAWLGPKGLSEKSYPLVPLQRVADPERPGRTVVVDEKAPPGALVLKDWDEAQDIAKKLNSRCHRKYYAVVQWEETI